MAEIFIFAMAYGFSSGLTPQPLDDPLKNMPQDAFKPDMRNLMRAVAIAHSKGIEVIMNHSDVVKICEEYANSAFPQMYNSIRNRQVDLKPEEVLEKLVRDTEAKRSGAEPSVAGMTSEPRS